MSTSRYQQDGFYLYDTPQLPASLIMDAMAGMDAIRHGEYNTGHPPYESPWNPGDDPNKLCKIEMPQLASKAVMELVSHPTIGKLAAELTGAEQVQVWWVQLLYKPPSPTNDAPQTNIGMHQDYHYWQNHWETGSELFTAWVALSDVTEEAGAMHFVRGSHQWGLGDDSDFFAQDLDHQRETIHTPANAQWEEVPAILPAGGISFHNCLVYHGSGPNRSPHPRRSFAIHLRTEKSKVKNNIRQGLTEFIDDYAANPIIYKRSF